MAQPQKTETKEKPQTKKQATELPIAVKKVVAQKIVTFEDETTTIRRRSEMKDKLQNLATWLKSEEPVLQIAEGKSQKNDDDPKKESQKILKKAADNLLKNIGVKAKEEPEKPEGPEGVPASGEAEEASEGDGPSD